MVRLWIMPAGTVLHAVGIGDHDADLLKALAKQTRGLHLDLARPSAALEAAAQVLEGLGPDAAPAVEGLVALLGHEDHEVRLAAIRALGAVGQAAAGAARALERATEDAVEAVAEAARRALERVGRGR